ncbi:MAG: hypothetical protein AUJ71_04485 [Candidatus Omnitrophica bacterium CG1_02_49_16]|nr:MAG: hypothetical protein AUJ71_04485 [Candidatus Omnitrophica bacterium CG1_02_49_16]
MPKQDKPLKQHALLKRLRFHKAAVLETGNPGSHNLQLVGYDKFGKQQIYPLPNKREYDRNYLRAIRDRFGLTLQEFYSD